MKRWEYEVLFGLGLLVTLAIAGMQNAPGYMDADYYYAGGMQIASGRGFTEPFLWNYLDNPAGLPHPAFTYWMPLASLLAAAGMALTGELDFFSARLVFLILAGCVPVITGWLAFRLTRRRVTAWTAGGLAVLVGLYAVYMGLTETITLYMLLGTAFLAVAASSQPVLRKAALLGCLAGGMHLARADGMLWLGIGLFILLLEGWKLRGQRRFRVSAGTLGLLILGYAMVMGIWFGRNLAVFHSLLPPGSGQALWMVDYDQLYNYPASSLNFQTWLTTGWPALFQLRWDAFLVNLQTALAVQGEVFLTPLILAGMWRLRKDRIVQAGAWVWLLTLTVMTLGFPLAGSRGGFLHSGAAFQPLFWAAAAEGLAGFIALGVRLRNWKMDRATVGFGILAVMIAGLLTVAVVATRIPVGEEPCSGWSASWEQYQQVDEALDQLSVPVSQVVMVNNPPGFFVASGRPAIAIPNGGVDTLLAAARRYQGTYLVLEQNTVKELLPLYNHPQNLPGLKYLEAVGKIYIFEITAIN